MSSPSIKTAIFPVAGKGSRLQPFTHYLPKEMMPIYDRPLLDYTVNEALDAGIEHFIFVTSPHKPMITEYIFDAISGPLLAKEQCDIVMQHEAKGLGHAILQAKDVMHDPYMAVIAPDDILITPQKKSAIGALIQTMQQHHHQHDATSATQWAMVEHVADNDISKYGIVDIKHDYAHYVEAKHLVEKPHKDVAPSNLAIIARYILPRDIFAILETLPPGKNNEIQLTDAMLKLMPTCPFFGSISEHTRLDCGHVDGVLEAANHISMLHHHA